MKQSASKKQNVSRPFFYKRSSLSGQFLLGLSTVVSVSGTEVYKLHSRLLNTSANDALASDFIKIAEDMTQAVMKERRVEKAAR
jgi:hypothetical protein